MRVLTAEPGGLDALRSLAISLIIETRSVVQDLGSDPPDYLPCDPGEKKNRSGTAHFIFQADLAALAAPTNPLDLPDSWILMVGVHCDPFRPRPTAPASPLVKDEVFAASKFGAVLT